MKKETVKVQLDNCRLHIKPPEFASIADEFNTNRLTIQSYFQPSNSPDTNVLDLGIFNAIQIKYYSNPPQNFGELVEAVERAYDELEPEKINQCFLSLQGCMNEIIDSEGGNTYSIPHMNKAKMSRDGTLPASIPVTANVKKWLEQTEQNETENTLTNTEL